MATHPGPKGIIAIAPGARAWAPVQMWAISPGVAPLAHKFAAKFRN